MSLINAFKGGFQVSSRGTIEKWVKWKYKYEETILLHIFSNALKKLTKFVSKVSKNKNFNSQSDVIPRMSKVRSVPSIDFGSLEKF